MSTWKKFFPSSFSLTEMPVPLKRPTIMLPGHAKRAAPGLVVSKRPTNRTVGEGGGAAGGSADAEPGGVRAAAGTCGFGGSCRVHEVAATATKTKGRAAANVLRTSDDTCEG